MSNNEQPLLIVMLGHAGSGKSYFARQLAEAESFIRLSSDAMRFALTGSSEAIRLFEDKAMLNAHTFRSIDYATRQVLLAGETVIYDSNFNKKAIRAEYATLAEECGAKLVVVWVKAPRDIAITRGLERDEQEDQRKHADVASAEETVDKHIHNTDEPDSSEHVIVIDGTAPFSKQIVEFKDGLRGLL